MMKQIGLFGAALAVSAGAILPASAADARHHRYDRGYYEQGYQGREYRGDDGYARYRPVKRCSDGTTGAIVGAIAGGLLGRVIDRGGDRSVGTLVGAGAGGLAGRAIERDGSRNAEYQGRCYR